MYEIGRKETPLQKLFGDLRWLFYSSDSEYIGKKDVFEDSVAPVHRKKF